MKKTILLSLLFSTIYSSLSAMDSQWDGWDRIDDNSWESKGYHWDDDADTDTYFYNDGPMDDNY